LLCDMPWIYSDSGVLMRLRDAATSFADSHM
jgi:hypothetical protein